MKVSDVMTTDVVSVSPDTNLGAVAQRMAANSVSGLPVLTSAGRLVGIITEGDLIRGCRQYDLPVFLDMMGTVVQANLPTNFEDRLESLLRSPAGRLMTTELITVGPDDTLETAAEYLSRYRLGRLPVVNQGMVLLGIISRSDLIRAMTQPQA